MTENNKITALEKLRKFKKTFDEYSDLFFKNHPDILVEESAFGPPRRIYDLAITAQAQLNSLGETAKKRFEYIGFNLVVPFDNPVEHYNWREFVKEKRIHNTIYLSIITRIDSEIERINKFIEHESFDMYNMLSESEYLTSKEKYDDLFNKITTTDKTNIENTKKEVKSINVNELNITIKNEQKGLKLIEKLNNGSGLFANIASIISKF